MIEDFFLLLYYIYCCHANTEGKKILLNLYMRDDSMTKWCMECRNVIWSSLLIIHDVRIALSSHPPLNIETCASDLQHQFCSRRSSSGSKSRNLQYFIGFYLNSVAVNDFGFWFGSVFENQAFSVSVRFGLTFSVRLTVQALVSCRFPQSNFLRH